MTNSQEGAWSLHRETDTSGHYIRSDRTFRKWIKADGSTEYPPEPNRYHLYISYACPWAHRTIIMRNLKGLEDVISCDVVHPILEDKTKGWTFEKSESATTGDTVNGFQNLSQLYKSVDPTYSETFTVPVLFDKKTKTIVNNESSEIIRMLNSEFNEFAKHPRRDYYPEQLRNSIDEINEYVYHNINNGVYKCGFARTQQAYDEHATNLFTALDKVEEILSHNRYLCGDTLTEADLRLVTTLFRFDMVYYVHFKTNKQHVYEYPNIWGFTRELFQKPEIRSTVNFDHIKRHYYVSHKHINPFGLVPIGPVLDFEKAHSRGEREIKFF